jgi:hypothetical protein
VSTCFQLCCLQVHSWQKRDVVGLDDSALHVFHYRGAPVCTFCVIAAVSCDTVPRCISALQASHARPLGTDRGNVPNPDRLREELLDLDDELEAELLLLQRDQQLL